MPCLDRALFTPEKTPGLKSELEPDWLNEFRERLAQQEASQQRIEQALDALLQGGASES